MEERTEGAMAPAASDEALPEPLQAALRKELCPGEQVEAVIRPSASNRARRVQDGVRALWWMLCLGTLAVLSLGSSWLGTGGGLALAILGLLSRAYTAGQFAYVITNLRCFRISAFGRILTVHDVDEDPDDRRLGHQERRALHTQLQRLAERRLDPRATAALASSTWALFAGLPRAARAAVEQALQPNENLLWLDQPRPRDYLLHAPLDVSSTLGFLGGSILAAVALVAADLRLSCGLTALGLLALAAGKLWYQIRGTVYAVTDRRGFVAVPGLGVTTYELEAMRRFHRTQDAGGRGALTPAGGNPADGFYGVRDVKDVDDLIKQRSARDRSTELIPARSAPGRGDEITPTGAEGPPDGEAA